MKSFYFLLCAFCFLLSPGCRPAAPPVSVSSKPVSINNVPQTNLPLPSTRNIENLGWTVFDQGQQKLGDYKGKVLVLDFWATYCPPCLEEIPHLVSLQEKHGSDNFQVIGLHVGGEEDQPKVPAFVQKLKMNYPIATPEEALTDILFAGESAIPQTFVFDRRGKLVDRFVGYDLKVKNELDKSIEQALSQ